MRVTGVEAAAIDNVEAALSEAGYAHETISTQFWQQFERQHVAGAAAAVSTVENLQHPIVQPWTPGSLASQFWTADRAEHKHLTGYHEALGAICISHKTLKKGAIAIVRTALMFATVLAPASASTDVQILDAYLTTLADHRRANDRTPFLSTEQTQNLFNAPPPAPGTSVFGLRADALIRALIWDRRTMDALSRALDSLFERTARSAIVHVDLICTAPIKSRARAALLMRCGASATAAEFQRSRGPSGSGSLTQKLSALAELVETETRYVERLGTGNEVWRPAVEQCKIGGRPNIECLFDGLYKLFLRHKNTLELIKTNPKSITHVADVLAAALPNYVTVYKEYVTSRNSQAAALRKFRENNTSLTDFERLQAAEAKEQSHPLDDVVMAPIQRIMRYPLMLDNLLDSIDYDDEDYPAVQRAAEACRTAANAVDSAQRALEGQLAVQSLGVLPPLKSGDTPSLLMIANVKTVEPLLFQSTGEAALYLLSDSVVIAHCTKGVVTSWQRFGLLEIEFNLASTDSLIATSSSSLSVSTRRVFRIGMGTSVAQKAESQANESPRRYKREVFVEAGPEIKRFLGMLGRQQVLESGEWNGQPTTFERRHQVDGMTRTFIFTIHASTEAWQLSAVKRPILLVTGTLPDTSFNSSSLSSPGIRAIFVVQRREESDQIWHLAKCNIGLVKDGHTCREVWKERIHEYSNTQPAADGDMALHAQMAALYDELKQMSQPFEKERRYETLAELLRNCGASTRRSSSWIPSRGTVLDALDTLPDHEGDSPRRKSILGSIKSTRSARESIAGSVASLKAFSRNAANAPARLAAAISRAPDDKLASTLKHLIDRVERDGGLTTHHRTIYRTMGNGARVQKLLTNLSAKGKIPDGGYESVHDVAGALKEFAASRLSQRGAMIGWPTIITLASQRTSNKIDSEQWNVILRSALKSGDGTTRSIIRIIIAHLGRVIRANVRSDADNYEAPGGTPLLRLLAEEWTAAILPLRAEDIVLLDTEHGVGADEAVRCAMIVVEEIIRAPGLMNDVTGGEHDTSLRRSLVSYGRGDKAHAVHHTSASRASPFAPRLAPSPAPSTPELPRLSGPAPLISPLADIGEPALPTIINPQAQPTRSYVGLDKAESHDSLGVELTSVMRIEEDHQPSAAHNTKHRRGFARLGISALRRS